MWFNPHQLPETQFGQLHFSPFHSHLPPHQKTTNQKVKKAIRRLRGYYRVKTVQWYWLKDSWSASSYLTPTKPQSFCSLNPNHVLCLSIILPMHVSSHMLLYTRASACNPLLSLPSLRSYLSATFSVEYLV